MKYVVASIFAVLGVSFVCMAGLFIRGFWHAEALIAFAIFAVFAGLNFSFCAQTLGFEPAKRLLDAEKRALYLDKSKTFPDGEGYKQLIRPVARVSMFATLLVAAILMVGWVFGGGVWQDGSILGAALLVTFSSGFALIVYGNASGKNTKTKVLAKRGE